MAGTAAPTILTHTTRGIVRTDVSILCDASGVATAAVVGVGFGRLVGVCYDGGLDASAVITVADAKTGKAIITYTTGTEGVPAFFRPSGVITDNVGVAVTAADTAPNVNRPIFLGGKVTVGVTSGGNLETGIFSLIVDETGVGDLAVTV